MKTGDEITVTMGPIGNKPEGPTMTKARILSIALILGAVGAVVKAIVEGTWTPELLTSTALALFANVKMAILGSEPTK